MTIRDLAHLLLTAPDLDKDVKIDDGFYADITNVKFSENGEFIIRASGYNMDKVFVKTEIEVKYPYGREPKIF